MHRSSKTDGFQSIRDESTDGTGMYARNFIHLSLVETLVIPSLFSMRVLTIAEIGLDRCWRLYSRRLDVIWTQPRAINLVLKRSSDYRPHQRHRTLRGGVANNPFSISKANVRYPLRVDPWNFFFSNCAGNGFISAETGRIAQGDGASAHICAGDSNT